MKKAQYIKIGECFVIELYEVNVPVPFMKTEYGYVDLRCGEVVNNNSHITIKNADEVTPITLRQAAELSIHDRINHLADLYDSHATEDLKIGDSVILHDLDGTQVFWVIGVGEGIEPGRLVKLRNDDGSFAGFVHRWAISGKPGEYELETPVMQEDELDLEVTERD